MTTRVQRLRNLSVLVILTLRGLHFSAADDQPMEVLQLGLKAAALPFMLGLLFHASAGDPPADVARDWRRAAEARSSNARVAAERQHAQSLERRGE